jgi:undecaprenyl-diphosphatase
LFAGLSRIGTLGLVWILIAILVAAVWKRPTILLMVLWADVVADLAAYAVKRIVDVDRPPLRYHEPPTLVPVPKDHSFPSGHSATSFACATILARALPSRAPLFYALAASIAFSRIYVGVHYPFDVVGGAVLGVLVARSLPLLVRAPRRSPRATPPD